MELTTPPYIVALRDILTSLKIGDKQYIKFFEPFVSVQEMYFYLNEEYNFNVRIEVANSKRTGYELYQVTPDSYINIFLFQNRTNGNLFVVRDDDRDILSIEGEASNSAVHTIIEKHGLKKTYSMYTADFGAEFYVPGRGAIQQLRGMPWEKGKTEAEVKNRIYSIDYLSRVKGDYGWFFIPRDQYAKFMESVVKDNFKLVEYKKEYPAKKDSSSFVHD